VFYLLLYYIIYNVHHLMLLLSFSLHDLIVCSFVLTLWPILSHPAEGKRDPWCEGMCPWTTSWKPAPCSPWAYTLASRPRSSQSDHCPQRPSLINLQFSKGYLDHITLKSLCLFVSCLLTLPWFRASLESQVSLVSLDLMEKEWVAVVSALKYFFVVE